MDFFNHAKCTLALFWSEIKFWSLGYNLEQSFANLEMIGDGKERARDLDPVLIIFAHPDAKNSLNARILDATKQALEECNVNYQVLDLYRMEKFNPILNDEEMKNRVRPEEQDFIMISGDSQIIEIQKKIQQSRHVICKKKFLK